MQYELEGSFNMLPIKLFPTFTVNSDYKKLDLNLKIFNKLQSNLRCKGLTITFKVPANVQRVYFKQNNLQQDVLWQDVKDMSSLSQYVSGTYLKPAANAKNPSPQLDPLG